MKRFGTSLSFTSLHPLYVVNHDGLVATESQDKIKIKIKIEKKGKKKKRQEFRSQLIQRQQNRERVQLTFVGHIFSVSFFFVFCREGRDDSAAAVDDNVIGCCFCCGSCVISVCCFVFFVLFVWLLIFTTFAF